MTVVHSLEGADALLPHGAGRAAAARASGTGPARPPRSERPIDMGPRPPAWSRAASNQERARVSVQMTLAAAVLALGAFISTRPEPGNKRAWLEAERPIVELRLSLAELRAIVSDYHVAQGAYPGCDANGKADPRWFEIQWNRAIERVRSLPRAGNAALQPAIVPGGAPTNPINGLATVRFLSSSEPFPAAADDTTGWVYKPATGELRANARGNVFGSGPAYWDL